MSSQRASSSSFSSAPLKSQALLYSRSALRSFPLFKVQSPKLHSIPGPISKASQIQVWPSLLDPGLVSLVQVWCLQAPPTPRSTHPLKAELWKILTLIFWNERNGLFFRDFLQLMCVTKFVCVSLVAEISKQSPWILNKGHFIPENLGDLG